MTVPLVELLAMRIRTLLATGLLVLATAACGGNGDKPSAAPSTTDRNAQAVKYSQCMRENGVPDFPDPQPNGSIQLGRDKSGKGIGPGDPAFDKAEEKCSQFMPGDREKRSESGDGTGSGGSTA